MEIKEIDYILALVNAGSMIQASKNLMITQSALSKYVQALEIRIGHPLFERTYSHNRLTLTPFGKVYVHYAKRIASERDAMQREITDIAEEAETVRVGIGLNLGHSHISEVLRDFNLLLPDCKIDIRSQRARQNQSDIKNGSLHFIHSTVFSEQEDLIFHPLYDDYLMVALSQSHPLAQKIKTDPTTGLPWIDYKLLQSELFIMQDERCYVKQRIQKFLESQGFNPNVLASTNSTNAALTLASQGNGICFCSSDLMFGVDNLAFATIGTPAYKSVSYLVTRDDEHLSPAAKAFARLYRQYNCSAEYIHDSSWNQIIK